MPRKKRVGRASWASKGQIFKTTEKVKLDNGEVINRGTLNVFGKYYRLTRRHGENVINYVTQIGQQYKSGLITETEYISLMNSLTENLESKRIGYVGTRTKTDEGRVGIFFENLLQKAGINDKLFKKSNMDMMTKEQRKQVNKFKKNMKAIEHDPLAQQEFYDVVSQYFKNVSSFYELMKEQGGRLTQDQINDMVSNIEWMNARFEAMKQTTMNDYA